MADIKYKNYRIGEHIFTVKFKKYRSKRKSIYFEITPVRNHVQTFWEEIKYFFNNNNRIFRKHSLCSNCIYIWLSGNRYCLMYYF